MHSWLHAGHVRFLEAAHVKDALARNIDTEKLKRNFDTSNFDPNAVLRGAQLTLVGAHRALQNPGIFTNDHYKQAALAVGIGIGIRVAVMIPVCSGRSRPEGCDTISSLVANFILGRWNQGLPLGSVVDCLSQFGNVGQKRY